MAGADACFIVVTGDIANTGDVAEYAVASVFLVELRELLQQYDAGLPVSLVLIPGNHDCNFRKVAVTREILINSSPTIDQLKSDGSIVEQCTSVQSDFFDFLSQMTNEPRLVGYDQLTWERRFTMSGKTILIRLFNTAWVSQKKEVQGQLFFPHELFPYSKLQEDLVLAAFHHPYNWLKADNARSFRRYLEGSCDLILTGHEHDGEYYEKTTIGGDRPRYTEGCVLQASESSESGFNVILIDLEEKKHSVIEQVWDGSSYRVKRETGWMTFVRSASLQPNKFENSKEFSAFLCDPGAPFMHPKPGLCLQEFFVYPDLNDNKKTSPISSAVFSEDIAGFVEANKRILILGADRSGKTSLAKSLYIDLQKRGFVPILLRGDSLKSPSEERQLKDLLKRFAEQYSDQLIESYRQLDRSSRVLIVDDIHKSKLNRKGLERALSTYAGFFDRIVLLGDTLFATTNSVSEVGNASMLANFRQYGIQKMGHRLRGSLIRKWFALGREYTANEAEFERQVVSAENLLNTLFGRNLIPAYPFFVLTILQELRKNERFEPALGSFGYFYQLLIDERLLTCSTSTPPDTTYTYLAAIAYYMFQNEQQSIDDKELDQITKKHVADYRVPLIQTNIIAELKSALIIEENDGLYRFKYDYVYYYFVAKYFQENLADYDKHETILEQLREMIHNVENEEYVNILVFLIYFTKDRQVIEHILASASSVNESYPPSDLNHDFSYLNELGSQLPEMVLDEEESKKARSSYRQMIDRAEEMIHEVKIDANDENGSESDSHEDLKGLMSEDDYGAAHLMKAMGTLRIIGQILRNFPGSLKGDLKLRLTRESYMLVLRTINAWATWLQRNYVDVRPKLMRMIKEREIVKDDSKLEAETDKMLLLGSLMFVSTLIKELANSVGSPQLRETYRDVLEESESFSVTLIDIAIALEISRTPPKREIFRLFSDIKDKPFLATLLRIFVFGYLVFKPVDYQTRQSLCDKLGIPIKKAEMLEERLRLSN
jgi:hypothetical protein